MDRREILKAALLGGSPFSLASCLAPASRKSSAHVIVVGGGFAGATLAKYVRRLANNIQVTLVEPKSQYVTCPASNWVLAGFRSLKDLKFDYRQLGQRYGIRVIQDRVVKIRADKHQVQLSAGQTLQYDRLVLAPGIDFNWQGIEGYDAQAALEFPHAWQAGEQTRLLHQQIMSMPDGESVIITAPANPFRCPPGPYERASLIASYLKQYKPKSKVIILDQKTHFSKQNRFIEAWRKLYSYGTPQSLIEWLYITDNPIVALDKKKRILRTDFGDCFQGSVLNIIPPQKAGKLAHTSDLVDESGWCPVTFPNSESSRYQHIHIIGDAAIYDPLPKSAFAANSEAKMCAFALVSELNQVAMPDPIWMNTCFSLLNEHQAISVVMVYKPDANGNIVKVDGAGGVTKDLNKHRLNKEAKFARYWYQSITLDSFF